MRTKVIVQVPYFYSIAVANKIEKYKTQDTTILPYPIKEVVRYPMNLGNFQRQELNGIKYCK